MSRRRWIVIGVVGTVVIVLGCGLLAAVITRVASPIPAATPLPPRTVSVVVTTHDVPVRSLLELEDITVMEVPVQLTPLQALSDPQEVVGRITMVPLATGETIGTHHLADPTNYTHDLAFVIDDEQVLMAIPSTDLMSSLNILEPGDVVDILVSLSAPVLPGPGAEAEEGSGNAFFTFDAMQQVEISAVVIEVLTGSRSTSSSTASQGEDGVEVRQQPTPVPESSGASPQALLIAIDPQNALVLKHIIDVGGIIDFVLRAPTATVRFELSPVMAEYLRDRFELTVNR